MRVELLEKIPESENGAGESARVGALSRAVQNFVAAIGVEDSLFLLKEPLIQTLTENPDGKMVLAGRFTLGFREAELASDRKLNQTFIESLAQLLKEQSSQSTLVARLCATTRRKVDTGCETIGLRLELEAAGETAELAMLRWELGIAHVQQAVLFLSRSLRHYLNRKGG